MTPASPQLPDALAERRALRRQLELLPTAAEPPSWQRFEPLLARAAADDAQASPRAWAAPLRGLAAVLVIAVASIALWLRGDARPDSPLTYADSPAVIDPRVAAPQENALVNAGTLAATYALEERIALMDELLTETRVAGGRREAVEALEARRTQLVGSLQQVRLADELIYDRPFSHDPSVHR